MLRRLSCSDFFDETNVACNFYLFFHIDICLLNKTSKIKLEMKKEKKKKKTPTWK